MQNRKDELDHFKSEINLCEYACAMYGFIFDQRSSSRCSAVVRHANGDKLIVTRRPNRHYVYFNVAGDDSGTILDFIQARRSVSLGKIRQELRAWSAVDIRMPVPSNSIQLEPSQHDAGRVLQTWVKTKSVLENNEYLTKQRQVPSSVIMDPIFDGQIRTDARNNVLFAHRNADGDLTGFEIKNRSFTGFAPGGVKMLFQSAFDPSATVAVVCETGIDLLSVAAIFGTQGKRFFSTAGQVSPAQMQCTTELLQSIPALHEVWLAFDNDDAGRKQAQHFTDVLSPVLVGTQMKPAMPKREGCDWNDQLCSPGKNDDEPKP